MKSGHGRNRSAFSGGRRISRNDMPSEVASARRWPFCRVTSIDAGDIALRRLTPRERRVALLVVEGLSNAEVAQHLHRSRRTIESQIASIYRRLGITRRAQLVRQLMDSKP